MAKKPKQEKPKKRECDYELPQKGSNRPPCSLREHQSPCDNLEYRTTAESAEKCPRIVQAESKASPTKLQLAHGGRTPTFAITGGYSPQRPSQYSSNAL